MIVSFLMVLSCWALAWVAVVGWGLLVLRLPLFGKIEISLSRAGWVGLTACLFVLQMVHFWWRIDAVVAGMILLVGAIGVAAERKSLVARFRLRPLSWVQVTVCVLAALWMARLSTVPRWETDTLLYHLQTVRWTQNYPVIVGIGNLHGRLAFNSAAELVFAALASGPWHDDARMLGNGFLWMLLVINALRCAEAPGDARRRAMRWFWAAFVPTLMTWAYIQPGTLQTDLPPFAQLAAAFALVLEALLTEQQADLRTDALVLAGWLAIGAIAMKLSAIACAAGLLIVCVAFAAKGRRLRLVAILAVGGVLLLGPWVARNVLMSGCLVYPVAATRLNLPWAVPTEMVRWEAYAIHTWALWDNWPPANDSMAAWVRNFLRGSVYEYSVWLVPMAMGAWLWIRSKHGGGGQKMAWLLLPVAAGVGFAMATAPTWRFLGPIVWLGAGVAAARFGASRPERHVRGFLVAMGALSLLIALGTGWTLLHGDWKHGEQWRTLVRNVWAPPTRPEPVMVTSVQTESGLKVYVPAEGAVGPPVLLQPYTHEVVGDAPLPASPYVHPSLRLRRAGDLAGGFEIVPNTR